MPLIAWLASIASAAEVVWLSPPSEDDRARVALAAGATGPALVPLDLRAAATRESPADAAAIQRLDQAVRDARAYETRLDGELVIMDDLAAPIAGVGLLRNDEDRGRLYAALAYQGFAVDRYFGADLPTDARAEKWRVEESGISLPSPWVDALALEPDREISPYEIAEAPQRMSYSEAQKHAKEALPASLVPTDLPAGAALIVDGRPTTPDAAGTIKVPPGRHLAHLVVDGAIVARWDVRAAAGQRTDLSPPLPSAEWTAFLDHLAPGAAVPAGLAPCLAALGGTVWIARGAGDDVAVVEVAKDRVVAVDLPEPAKEHRATTGGKAPSVLFSLGAGWMASADFWAQSPFDAPRTAATVNAPLATGSVLGELPVGPLRFGAGVDLGLPLGADHVALVGTTPFRPRPYPWLSAGIARAQLTAGWLFPWHPAVGAVGSIPLPGPIEIRPRAVLGIPRTFGGYSLAPLYWLDASVGVRL